MRGPFSESSAYSENLTEEEEFFVHCSATINSRWDLPALSLKSAKFLLKSSVLQIIEG